MEAVSKKVEKLATVNVESKRRNGRSGLLAPDSAACLLCGLRKVSLSDL